MPNIYFIKKRIYIFFNIFSSIVILMLILPLCLTNGQKAEAASASVSVTAKNNSVVKGDSVYIIITVDSSDEIGGFKGYFSYDNSVLKYVTGGTVTSGNDDEFLISDTDKEAGTYKIKYVVKFTARAAGSTSIGLKRPYSVYSYGDNQEEMSVSYIPLNIVVKKKTKMQTPQQEETPAPVQTEEPEAEKTQEPLQTEKPERTPEPEETKKPSVSTGDSSGNSGFGSIKTSVKSGEVVLNTKEKYTVTELLDDVSVPDGFGETTIKIGGQLVTAYASESGTEHKFVLIYCKKGNSEPEFYLYDREELTLMPYAKVQAWYRGNSDNAVVQKDIAYDTEIQKLKYILAIIIIICLLLVIIIISVYMHFKGMNKDDLTEILK